VSIAAILHVLNHSKTRQSHQLILLRLADHANSQGLSWPSKPTLARETGYGRQWIYTAIADLVRLGELRVVTSITGDPRYELHTYNTKTKTCTCEGQLSTALPDDADEGVVLHDSPVALVDEGVVSLADNLTSQQGNLTEPVEENLINARPVLSLSTKATASTVRCLRGEVCGIIHQPGGCGVDAWERTS
jgi:hypothetical protein